MKTLFVLRHAKSSWDDPESSDFDRPLNESGLKAAPQMGRFIKDKQLLPEIIVSSPAERAKQTAILVKEAAQATKTRIEYDERIYEASPHRLLQVVSEFDDDKKSAMLIGHNPGLEGLIKILSGEIRAMPTAGLAVIDLSVDRWIETSAGCGEVRALIRPEDDLKTLGAS